MLSVEELELIRLYRGAKQENKHYAKGILMGGQDVRELKGGA